MLSKTLVKTVDERRQELLIENAGNEYFRIDGYSEFDTMPEVKPLDGKPANIRFYVDGVEAVVGRTGSNRVSQSYDSDGRSSLENTPINTTLTCVLVDENRKRVLKYQIDCTLEEAKS